jgi:hypothetical protein
LQRNSESFAEEQRKIAEEQRIIAQEARPEGTVRKKEDNIKKQCCGSGIRCLFDPWIRDPPGWVTKIKIRILDPGSRMNISDHIYRELRHSFLV